MHGLNYLKLVSVQWREMKLVTDPQSQSVVSVIMSGKKSRLGDLELAYVMSKASFCASSLLPLSNGLDRH
jgi:hypothetical protein